MKFIIVAGTPGAGKTAVLVHTIKILLQNQVKASVVKIDCLYSEDDKRFAETGVPVLLGLSKDMCPDHFSIYNTDAIVSFAEKQGSDYLIMETAGLCHRCAPYTNNCMGVCVIDATSGPNNPMKVGPFLNCADVVIVTKGDMISQAEREIFRECIFEANPQCRIIDANGLSGQGAAEFASQIMGFKREVSDNESLRHNAPFSVCTLCAGEKRVGSHFHRGLLRKMNDMEEYIGE
jgi:Ni2+-binding GTPase involved in regulation of expression and maturation of urease and hydrogenase